MSPDCFLRYLSPAYLHAVTVSPFSQKLQLKLALFCLGHLLHFHLCQGDVSLYRHSLDWLGMELRQAFSQRP
jgi:hypothetical protein